MHVGIKKEHIRGHLLSRFINSIDQIRYAPLFDTPVKNKIMQSITKSIRLWDQQRLCTKMCFGVDVD
jgi:hypothetical protein